MCVLFFFVFFVYFFCIGVKCGKFIVFSSVQSIFDMFLIVCFCGR